MSIFQRRTLQRLIAENALFITAEQTERHVRTLNNGSPGEYLATEWEVVLLNAFSKAGRVLHEGDFGGDRSADMHFIAAGGVDLEFLADIRTVSDRSLHDRNPIEYFMDEYQRVLSKRGMPVGRFSCKVGRNRAVDAVRGRKTLMLPPKSRMLPDILKSPDFLEWLGEISQDPASRRSITFNTVTTDLVLGYDPEQRYFSTNFPAYRSVSAFDCDPKERKLPPFDRNLSNNPIRNALDRKMEQLKGTGYSGEFGIILCDGGCQMLRSARGGGRTGAEVVGKFLRDTQSVAFVLMVAVEYPSASLRDPRVRYSVAYNPLVPDAFRAAVDERIDAAFRAVPTPAAGADNALAWLEAAAARRGRSFEGGLQVTSYTDGSTTVRISARALLELLAGTTDQQRFFETHEFVPTEDGLERRRNPFEAALSAGGLITGVSFDPVDDRDDDWITLRLGPPDPAVTQFKI